MWPNERTGKEDALRSASAECTAWEGELQQRLRAEERTEEARRQAQIAEQRRLEADQQRKVAEERRRLAVSRQLMVESRKRLHDRHDLALLPK